MYIDTYIRTSLSLIFSLFTDCISAVSFLLALDSSSCAAALFFFRVDRAFSSSLFSLLSFWASAVKALAGEGKRSS